MQLMRRHFGSNLLLFGAPVVHRQMSCSLPVLNFCLNSPAVETVRRRLEAEVSILDVSLLDSEKPIDVAKTSMSPR